MKWILFLIVLASSTAAVYVVMTLAKDYLSHPVVEVVSTELHTDDREIVSETASFVEMRIFGLRFYMAPIFSIWQKVACVLVLVSVICLVLGLFILLQADATVPNFSLPKNSEGNL